MSNVPLLLADASEIILGALLQPTWGIYQNGAAVIQPASFLQNAIVSSIQPLTALASLAGLPGILPVAASTVEFEYRQDFPVSTYQQENGAFQAYDKVTLPFDVRLRLAASGSTTTRQNFINTCIAISQSIQTFDVVTPERTFASVNCNHIDFRREARRGNTLIQIDLSFIQIPVVSAVTPVNTANPGDSGQQALGNVQPQNLTTPQANALAAGSPPM